MVRTIEDLNVLLVEDDRGIAEQTIIGLRRHGMSVTHVVTGRSALLGHEKADIVLLDLGLPDLDGTEVCRRLRSRAGVPVIVLSGRSSEADRAAALDLGADDYLVKPYGLRELVARIHAVTRRSGAAPAWTLRVGGLELDRRGRRATRDGRDLRLTNKEFELLAVLMDHPDEVVERRCLLDEVWGGQWHGTGRTLDVHVAALRRKLGDPSPIETVRGIGLRLRGRA